MIPETLGHRVVFRFGRDGDAVVSRPVIAWSADGKPLVVSPDYVLIEAGVIAGDADYVVLPPDPVREPHCPDCCPRELII